MKWIVTKDERFYRYKCPVCGRCDTNYYLKTEGNIDLPNFCEKCGTDLRGKKMNIITKTIKDFEDLTGVPAKTYSLDFICGFMACHELMNTTIIKLDLSRNQLIRFEDEWRKIKTKGRL